MHLPKTTAGFDAICTVVDRMSKRVHWWATHTNVTARQLAQEFMEHVFQHHGMPEVIVSDRDAKFTSHFWRSLCKVLGTQQAMSSPYHPETDGQSERANPTLEDMLRSYVNVHHSDWDKQLP